jgi:hypothetical protein
MAEIADRFYGPRDIVVEGAVYTVSLTVFEPPIWTQGGVARNRNEPLPDWFTCYRRGGDFRQDFATFKLNGTAEYFDNPAFTEENYLRAQEAQRAEPSKETLLHAVGIKRADCELVAVASLLEQWLEARPDDPRHILHSYFRSDAGVWKMHNPSKHEPWHWSFPVTSVPQLKAILAASAWEKDRLGNVVPVAP